MKKHIAYLCLQATREGQASHAHVHEIVNGLRRRGWTVDLYEPTYAGAKTAPGPLGKLLEFWRVQRRLWKAAKGVDALYVRAHPAALPTALWAARRRLPTLQEINGPYEELFVGFPWTRRFAGLFRWVMGTPLKKADGLVVVTPQLKDWANSRVGEKPTFIISNGANTELFRPDARSERELPPTYAVFFGVLAKWQGVDTLLAAAEQPDWPNDVELVVVGDGMDRERVEAAAKQNRRIHYLGRVPYKEVAGIVAGSIGGLIPKNTEGRQTETGLSPLKVFETLACGVPAVVTDIPGQADLVRDECCGLVIPHSDPAALARAVAKLFNEPDERKAMGERGRAAVEREHSWDRRAADTEQALIQLIEGRI